MHPICVHAPIYAKRKCTSGKYGVLVDKMRAAMRAADIPTQMRPEVLQYIVDIDNMSATRTLKGNTPSEKLDGKKPDVSTIKSAYH